MYDDMHVVDNSRAEFYKRDIRGSVLVTIDRQTGML